MAYKPTTEYETAQSRISTLLDQIGEQLQAIATCSEDSDDIDSIIAEQEKTDVIFQQNELISAYRDRDVHDDRDSYIALLEAELDKAKKNAQAEGNRWYKEYQINKELKSAISSLTAVLVED